MATRVRTYDMLAIADYVAHELHNFTAWRCGAARRSTSRCASCSKTPGSVCARLREAIPNICFQMLLRASNAVGYTAYPDNVVEAFILEAARAGHRHLPHLRFAELAAEHGSRRWRQCARAAGSAKRPSATPATFSIRRARNIRSHYYVRLAKELESMGAHILGIKDMAGLCKPYAAYKLVKTLREEIGLPIHFHTHDTSGINAASDPEGGGSRRGRGGRRDLVHERHHQPAESQFDRGRAGAYASATAGSISMR